MFIGYDEDSESFHENSDSNSNEDEKLKNVTNQFIN